MSKQTQQKKALRADVIETPGYPFTSRELFTDLFARLANESGEALTFQFLGELVGRSKSTAHHWFGVSEPALMVALFCLLERLPQAQRRNFVESHCRVMPSLEDAVFVHSPARTGKLLELLRQPKGLTVVCGGTEAMRRFVVTACGHSYRRVCGRPQTATGIDVHRPTEIVPVASVFYVDPSRKPAEIKQCLLKIWPRVQTSGGTLVTLSGIWQRAPELRSEVLRCANRKHVVLAECGLPDLQSLRRQVSTPLHVVQVSGSKRTPGGILLRCRRIKSLKRPKSGNIR
jgi:hypothetical protein